jgi:glycosyltransferase involved in cell wall biosynthesis
MKHAATRWICCQLGAREHYAVPRALHRCHVLDLLLTDTWIRPENLLGRLKPNLRARFHPDLATANVYAANRRGIAFELRAKVAGLHTWTWTIARNEWFQKLAVAKLSRIEPGYKSRTLMAYSYAALQIFRLARARGWRTVLGQIDPGPPEERIVARLYEESPPYRGQLKRPPSQYWADWREECALADCIVVNSLWSQAALVDEGVPAAKIRVVPLAYEKPKVAKGFQREYPAAFTPSRPLRVLFLGQINLRKGIGPLLDAVRMLRGEPIEFWFVGPVQVSIPPDLRDDPQVRWIGSVPHEQTARFYREADIFMFPTFSDGFGLTQLEAQAWKLPIVATKFCGEVVEDGKNGWLLPEITPRAIATIIRWCRTNPVRLQELSASSGRAERLDLAFVGKQWLNAVA